MIYFIGVPGTEVVKIGYARSVVPRLSQLQSASFLTLRVYRTFAGAKKEEWWLHQHYSKNRLRGEWFTWDKSMTTILPPGVDVRSDSCRGINHFRKLREFAEWQAEVMA